MFRPQAICSGLFLLLITILSSQNEQSKWYFGNKAALDFMNNGPAPLLNSAMNAGEGCASIADAAGNLLFYTNGAEVYNKNHQVMANGSNMPGGFSSVQSSLIIKDLQFPAIYHLFTTTDGLVSPLAHNIIDMSLAAGLGSVTVKNNILDASVSQRLHGALHCNERDRWIIANRKSTNEYVAFLLTPGGLQSTPVISSGGPVIHSYGSIKVSPAGNKVGVTDPTATILFDFNAATGQMTNPLVLETVANYGPYGCEFSPDGSRFYASRFYQPHEILQWSVCAGSDSAVLASHISIFSGQQINYPASMQIGLDKKLYIASGSFSLSVIHFPNLAGSSCSFSPLSVGLGNRLASYGLPNFIVARQKPQATVSTTVQCGQVAFTYSLPPAACTIPAYQPTSIKWRFGDQNASGKDTSSAQNPSYVFSKNGSYTISLLVNYPCATDTFKKVVTINTIPQLTVSGQSKICKNESASLTASGAISFSWSSGQQTASVSLSPSVTTVYTITGTSNGCQGSREHTVIVDPCVGISTWTNSKRQIYPNPAGDFLILEGYEGYGVKIIDLIGNTIMTLQVLQSEEQVDVSVLSKGIYLLESQTGERRKFVKE